MQHYEIVLLVHPEQNDQVGAMMERYRSMITNGGGQIHHNEDWGRRQLASPVQRMHKARYLLMSIECNAETLGELEQMLRFNDAVLRHLVTRRDGPLTEPSALAREKKERDRKQRTRAARPEPDSTAAGAGPAEDDAPLSVAEDPPVAGTATAPQPDGAVETAETTTAPQSDDDAGETAKTTTAPQSDDDAGETAETTEAQK